MARSAKAYVVPKVIISPGQVGPVIILFWIIGAAFVTLLRLPECFYDAKVHCLITSSITPPVGVLRPLLVSFCCHSSFDPIFLHRQPYYLLRCTPLGCDLILGHSQDLIIVYQLIPTDRRIVCVLITHASIISNPCTRVKPMPAKKDMNLIPSPQIPRSMLLLLYPCK